MSESLLGDIRVFTDVSQIWKRYPVNYNPKTHELTWSYSKLSDIYSKLYKEQKREDYIKMQESILYNLLTSLNQSCISYNRSKKGFFLDSHVCFIHAETLSRTLSHSNNVTKEIFKSSPIISFYKEGILQNRSDICIASNQSVCIKYIHTHELGPPRYQICWNWTAVKDPMLRLLIERNKTLGKWNILSGDSPTTLCILEQY